MADLINFKSSMDAFQVGRRANMEEWNTVTGNNPNVAVIPFGAPVMASGTYNGCLELDATTGRNVMGITEASLMLPHPGDGYRQYDNVAVCEVGVIGVKIGASAVTWCAGTLGYRQQGVDRRRAVCHRRDDPRRSVR